MGILLTENCIADYYIITTMAKNDFWLVTLKLFFTYINLYSQVQMKKILGGLGVYQKMLVNLVSWLRALLNWNRLKCPVILNWVEVGYQNF